MRLPCFLVRIPRRLRYTAGLSKRRHSRGPHSLNHHSLPLEKSKNISLLPPILSFPSSLMFSTRILLSLPLFSLVWTFKPPEIISNASPTGMPLPSSSTLLTKKASLEARIQQISLNLGDLWLTQAEVAIQLPDQGPNLSPLLQRFLVLSIITPTRMATW